MTEPIHHRVCGGIPFRLSAGTNKKRTRLCPVPSLVPTHQLQYSADGRSAKGAMEGNSSNLDPDPSPAPGKGRLARSWPAPGNAGLAGRATMTKGRRGDGLRQIDGFASLR
jgi:hypothetical protein